MSETNNGGGKGQWVRVAVDYLAPIAFVAVILTTHDFQLATWVLVGASAIALIVGWVAERKLAPMPLIAGGAALVFGALTLIFKDPSFVKMKMTVIDVALAAAILGGMAMGKMPLKSLMGSALEMPDHAWRTLSIRYALFFLACAVVNEVVWRTQSDERWGVWRLVALGAALVFSVFQAPLLMKYMRQPDEAPPPSPPDPGF